MFRWTPFWFKVPAAIRKQVWIAHAGNAGTLICTCCEKEVITPFDFHCAHIVAETKGGKSNIANLLPACGLCNQSMSTTNFYVFKSKLHSKQYYDINNMNDTQKKVVEYYVHASQNMTINLYHRNFHQWFKVIEKSMRVTKDGAYECKCKYKFAYSILDKDFALTCKGNKQNIIDVICDHIPCLINDTAFIHGTMQMDDFSTTKKI